MIRIRELGRLGKRALVAVFVLATISCGGPGSAGTVNQDFQTADEIFTGKFSGEFTVAPFQTAQFTFTGTDQNTISAGTIRVETDPGVPEGTPVTFNTEEQELTGTFDKTNAAFSAFGTLFTQADEEAGISSEPVSIQITGQGGGSFTSTNPGSFTATLSNGTTASGILIRGNLPDT